MPRNERVEFVVAGGGPAGLRAAQVLADAGRDVLVVERREEIGPKTCAGGLTPKAVAELEALGLPPGVGLVSQPVVSFDGRSAIAIDDDGVVVRTIARARLGQHQLAWARRAGAEVACGADVREIDLAGRRVRIGDRQVRYEHLIGADGSASRIRRALGLPGPRAYFAGEFNVPGVEAGPLRLAFDSRLASGYFWIFPHDGYTSIGAGAPVRLVRPSTVRDLLEHYLDEQGVGVHRPSFEGATIEVAFRGFHFGHVHLVGDAAGVASAVTGEGIYAALVTGEEVARQILEPGFPAPKTRAWMRVKRLHDALARAWLTASVRRASFSLLEQALRQPWWRPRAAAFFLAG